MYRSLDHGTSWSRVLNAGYGADAIAIDPVRPNIIYAGIQEWAGAEDFYEARFLNYHSFIDWSIGESVLSICPSRTNTILFAGLLGYAENSVNVFERSINLVLNPETLEVAPGQVLGIDATLTNFLNRSVSASVVLDVYLDDELIYYEDPTIITLMSQQTLSHRFGVDVPPDANPGSILRVQVQIGEEPDFDTDWDAFEATVVSP